MAKSKKTKVKSKTKHMKSAKSAFPRGKKVTVSKLDKLIGHREPQALVLDRVAKTFAYLQEEREKSDTPMVDERDLLLHTDLRGEIANIIHEPVGAVAVITSHENTVRANHYHKADAHLCYVVSGRIEYYERPVGSIETPEKFIVDEGRAFYTGPRMEHAMYFPEETVFITLGRLSRTPDAYEDDLVRLSVPLVQPLSKEEFLKKLGIEDPNTTPVGGTPVVTETPPAAVEPTGGVSDTPASGAV